MKRYFYTKIFQQLSIKSITFNYHHAFIIFYKITEHHYVNNSGLLMEQLKMAMQNKHRQGFLVLWLSKQSTHQTKLALLLPIYLSCTSPYFIHEQVKYWVHTANISKNTRVQRQRRALGKDHALEHWQPMAVLPSPPRWPQSSIREGKTEN